MRNPQKVALDINRDHNYHGIWDHSCKWFYEMLIIFLNMTKKVDWGSQENFKGLKKIEQKIQPSPPPLKKNKR